MDTQVEIKKIAVVREVLHIDCQSHNLIGPYHFCGMNLTLFIGLFLTKRRGLGTRLSSTLAFMYTIRVKF